MKRLSSDEEGVKVKLYNDDNVTSIRSREQLPATSKFTTWKKMLLACITVYGTLVL